MANKIVVRNSIILIIRLLFSLVISLITSKVLLSALGVDTYGVFNVALGVVMLMGFLHGALTSAFQRFFSFYNNDKCYYVFLMSLKTISIVAIFLLILNMTLGFWFVSNEMNSLSGLQDEIEISYILVAVGFVFSVITIPFYALLISRNKAVRYSICTLSELFFKLISACIVLFSGYGVVHYGFLYMFTSFISFLLIFFIAFPDIKNIKKSNDGERIKNVNSDINSYILWSVWGNLASALSTHGGNILINMFFLPVHSASRVVATQLGGILNSGINSMQLSLTPLLVKFYAEGNTTMMLKTAYRASRIYFNLSILISIPCCFYAKEIMELWLSDNNPQFASYFFQLTLLFLVIESLSPPLKVCAQATGNIKKYQLVIGLTLLLIIPVTFFLYQNGFGVESIYWVTVAFSIICLIFRLILLKNIIGLNIKVYFLTVKHNLILSVFFYFLIFVFIQNVLFKNILWVLNFTIYCIVATIFYFLLETNSKEKKYFINIIKGVFYGKHS